MTTPIASFSGLATGLDTTSLIESFVEAERIPIRQLEVKKLNIDSMSRRMMTVRTRTAALQSSAEELNSPDKILASSVSSANEDAIVATAIGGAALGTYNVDVTSLAQAERTYSDTFADKETAGLFGEGTLTIQVGTGTAYDITVDATDDLESVAAKINDTDAEVTASVIFDGTNYRLQVSGLKTGAANDISFTEGGTLALGLSNPANQVVAASDAVFSIDGIAMTRPTNSVVSAIAGVTLDLKSAGQGPVAITIAQDSQALEEKVQAFIDNYNALANGINSEFAFSGAAQTGNSLSADSTLRGLQSQLGFDVVSPVTGLPEALNTFRTLGITTTQTGSLELDREALVSALDSDPDGVIALLAGDEDAGVTGLMQRFEASLDVYAAEDDGLLSQRIDSYEEQQRDIDDRIASMELRIDKFEENLRREFANLEVLVAGIQAQGQSMIAMFSGLTQSG